MQKKKGISLIVLVITIIVMIVLAGTIILSLNNSGIIGKANQAVRDTDEATVKELAQMAWAEAYADEVRTVEGEDGFEARVKTALKENRIDTSMYLLNVTTKGVTAKLLTNAWVQAKDEDGNPIVKKGEDTLTIGQSVTYDEGVESYTGGWKVLGADADGNFLIMSDTNVATVKLGDSTINAAHKSWKTGASDITKAVQEAIPLETAPNAISVRSIEVEDIDKVTGYDKTKYGSSTVPYQYGNTVTYTYNGNTKPSYTGVNGATGDLTTDHNKKGFYWSDGKDLHHIEANNLTAETNEGKEIATLTSNCYYYYPTTLTTSLTGDIKGIDTDTDAYKMLFKNGDNTEDVTYWLASPFVLTSTDKVYFGLHSVREGRVICNGLFDSDGTINTPFKGTRAVITLSSDITTADLI